MTNYFMIQILVVSKIETCLLYLKKTVKINCIKYQTYFKIYFHIISSIYTQSMKYTPSITYKFAKAHEMIRPKTYEMIQPIFTE